MGVIDLMFFSGLYPNPEDHSKIDLASPLFYRDAVDLYCNKESERINLIKGIEFLAYRVRVAEELYDVINIWEHEKILFVIREGFAQGKPGPNLVTEFKEKVTSIMESRKAYFEKKGKQLEIRIEKKRKNNIDEHKRILNELDRERKLNDILLNRALSNEVNIQAKDSHNEFKNVPNIQVVSANSKEYHQQFVKGKKTIQSKNEPKSLSADVEFLKINVLLEKVIFKKKESFGRLIEEQNESKVNPKKIRKGEFTALASILYNSGWLVKGTSFEEWLSSFSETYNVQKPKFKETQVKKFAAAIHIKAPFLEDLLKK